MTFVRGTTTYGALSQKITQLICGEVPDDTSTTVATGDRWVRQTTRTVTDGVLNSTTTITSVSAAFTNADVGSWVIGTGIPAGTSIASVTNATTAVLSQAATASASAVTLQICLDTIKTPAAKDVALASSANRTGYFAAWGVYSGGSTVMATPATTVCRLTGPYTSEPSPSVQHRWVLMINITTVNTVPGNYGTAQINYQVFGDGTSFNSSGNFLNAAGQITLGNGVQIQITDPSGTLQAGTFSRAFTSTYMYGIDHWPMHFRASGAATFGTPPPGVAGTDYDVLSGQIAVPPFPSWGYDRGSMFYGLGIKTATGLAAPGALYTVSESVALVKMRIFNSGGGNAGQIGLDWGDSRPDNVLPGNIRCIGLRLTSWNRVFQTPGSVTAAAPLQYWMSVKNDGIVLVLNGDTGFSGKMGASLIGAMTPVEPTYDLFPVVANWYTPDFTADNQGANDNVLTTQNGYWATRRRQDGSEGTRDWQTKWMRCEGNWATGASGQQPADITPSSNPDGRYISVNNGWVYQQTTLGQYTQYQYPQSVPARQNKPNIDGKWWLYGYTIAEGVWGFSSSQTAIDENRFIRLTGNTRVLYIPSDGWGSGDELTDTGTGTKYLLVAPDYAGFGMRLRGGTANQFFGGAAMAEL